MSMAQNGMVIKRTWLSEVLHKSVVADTAPGHTRYPKSHFNIFQKVSNYDYG